MVNKKDKSLVDIAYESIRQKICDFEFIPGQSISDFTLCKELGMSRTPVRQALQRIERDGLIHDGGVDRGYIVNEITPQEIEDLFDARACIELYSLELAFEKGIKSDHLESLTHINSCMYVANEKKQMRQQFFYDQKFHDKLVFMSGNNRLMKFNDILLLQLTRARVLSYLERTYQQKAFEEHKQLIENIRKSDRTAAKDVLKHHIESTKINYINLLNNKVNMESFGVLSFIMKSGD